MGGHLRRGQTFCLGLVACAALAAGAAEAARPACPPLKLSADGRTLVRSDGTPFFWMADTSWALHQNLSRADVLRYLDDTRALRFNVVQLMSVNSWALKDWKNFYGHAPYLDDQPWKLNPSFWNHLGWVMDQAAERGLLVLLVFGSPGRTDNHGAIARTPEEGYEYGHALGSFFRAKTNLVWSGGIDVNPDDAKRVSAMGMAGWHAMAEGVTDGVAGVKQYDRKADWSAVLMTYHPRGGSTSSTWFHEAPWLDFNGAQVGLRGNSLLQTLPADYRRRPVKPVLNLEPWYEGVNWKKPPVNDWDVRVQAYQSVFAGACGHTYGHTYIWAFDSPDRQWGGRWRECLEAPGRRQMQHLRQLIESHPAADRAPRQDLLAASPENAHQSLLPTRRIAALCDADGTFALVYSPRGDKFTMDMSKLAPGPLVGNWFNPRTGETAASVGGLSRPEKTLSFDPPGEAADGNDWILVIHRASRQ